MMDAVQTIGVVGASGRAAVMSLARAGFSAWAVDLFADRDLARLAPCARCPVEDYPDGIPALAARFPPGPVLYTGGLENYPDVVRELAARRPLWGNGPDVLDRVRDPFQIAECLLGEGFTFPGLIAPGEPCPAAGSWLMKSRRSSGGLGVRATCPGERPGSDSYLQEFIDGVPMSAVFLDGFLMTVTRQLIGTTWLHASPFHYAGSVGPVRCEPPWCDDLHHLGIVLRDTFGLRGVWGVDFLLHAGRVWPIEVNPRYPASMEVFELHYGTTVMPHHGTAFGATTGLACGPSHIDRIIGKAIYYAPRPLTFPPAGPWDADLSGPFDPWRRPTFADIPAAGERIEAGSPVLTVFASGSTPDECRGRLQSRAAELDNLFD